MDPVIQESIPRYELACEGMWVTYKRWSSDRYLYRASIKDRLTGRTLVSDGCGAHHQSKEAAEKCGLRLWKEMVKHAQPR